MLKFGESSSGQRWICSRISEALSVAKKNIRSSKSCLTKQLTSDRIRCSAPVDACQNGTSVAIKVRLEVAMVVGLAEERLAEERRLWAFSVTGLKCI